MFAVLIGFMIGTIVMMIIYRRRISRYLYTDKQESKHLYVEKHKIKRMSDEEYQEREIEYVRVETKYNTLVKLIDKKIIDLQDQLLKHSYKDDFKLNDNDVIRFSAMIEILKTVREA